MLIGLWFWYDPQPAFAEMLLPLLAPARAAANASGSGASAGGPLVALLCDDAHSERARLLQREETHARTRERYGQQARNLAPRRRKPEAAAD